jgi:hypothetical protein
MLVEILDKIFKLPPVEGRVEIKESILKKIALPDSCVREKDDTYIYYQVALASLIISAVLSLFFLGTYLMNLNFLFNVFGIEKKQITIDDMFLLHSNLSLFIYPCVIVPFFFIKLRWNINPKHYQIDWWRKPEYRNLKPLSECMRAIGLIVSFFLFAWLIRYTHGTWFFRRDGSFLELFLAFAIIAWVLEILAMCCVISLVTLYRYIGHYSK